MKSKKLSKNDLEIEAKMLELLRLKGRKSSICLSAPLRCLYKEECKKSMEKSKMAARRLVAKGVAVILQSGRVVEPSAAKGEIRVQLL